MANTLTPVIDMDAFANIEKVAALYTSGITSPYTIARRLSMKVNDVRFALEQWHGILKEDSESRDMAREALHVMLKRYDDLLIEANSNLKDLKTLDYDEKVSAQINATIKVIADLDKTRVSLLQQAGILDNNDLGDDLAERERREEMLLGILRNDLCDSCRITVRDKITQLTGTVEGTVVDG